MTDKALLLELAERVEKATGPDRELDGEIEVARDPNREVILYNEPGRFPQKPVRGPVSELEITGHDLADYIGAPTFTASIDAAMTLVPEGWRLAGLSEPEQATDKAGAAVVENGGLLRWTRSDAATLANALTAAALRARAAQS